MSATQIKNIKSFHERLVEYLIANPRASGSETALFFNVSESWLSIVKNSDAFRELWASRSGVHFSRVSASLVEKVEALADITVDALTEKLERDKAKNELTYTTLKEVGDMALKSLGFGNRNTNIQVHNSLTPVQNNFFIDKETLARARDAKAQLAENLPKASLSLEYEEKEKEIANSF